MRHAVYVSAGTVFWTVVLVCYFNTKYVQAAPSEDVPIGSKSEDPSSQQLESSMSKRDWNRNLGMWGKRSWENLHGGWNLKKDPSTWGNYNYPPLLSEKRAWQNLQGGWGKRFAPDDEYAIQQLASLLEDQQQIEPQYSSEFDSEPEPNDDEKRAWKQFNNGWGKRAESWKNFRGSWGKREPAWNHLKGIWGK